MQLYLINHRTTIDRGVDFCLLYIRLQFLIEALVLSLIGGLIGIVSGILIALLGFIIGIVALVGSVSLIVKRLHDLDKGGLWALVMLIPLVNFFFGLRRQTELRKILCS